MKLYSLLSIFYLSTISLLYAQKELAIKKVNLGKPINTSGLECGPIVSNDGKKVYYNYLKSGSNYSIYVADVATEGKLINPRPIKGQINNDQDNEILAFGVDGEMYVKGKYGEDVEDFYEHEGISVSHLGENGEWSLPIPVQFAVEPKWESLCYLSISEDGKNMILAIGNGSQGDLYYCKKIKEQWTEPKLISPNINEPDRQETPFISRDGRKLYFASNGHGGYGDMDIFVSNRLDDTWLNWSDPVNVGDTINSPFWDTGFHIDKKGDFAYMLSWEDTYGEGDLFMLRLKPERGLDFTSAKVTLCDKQTKKPIQTELLLTSQNISTAIVKASTKADGTLLFPSNEGDFNFAVKAKKKGYFTLYDSLIVSIQDTSKINKVFCMQVDTLYMQPIKLNTKVVLQNIYFKKSSDYILPNSSEALEDLYLLMKENPTVHLEIVGHTDNVGKKHLNYRLSLKRAFAVKNYLVDKGISDDRFKVKGKGMSEPISDNDTESGRKRNRRVEVEIIKI